MKKKGRVENLTPGNPKATGRPPDWFKKECENRLEKTKLPVFLQNVIVGGLFSQPSPIGIVEMPPPIKDRIAAGKLLKEFALGMEDQNRKINLQFILDFSQKVVMVLGRTVPDNCPHCKKHLGLRDDTIRELDQLSQSQNLEMEAIKR